MMKRAAIGSLLIAGTAWAAPAALGGEGFQSFAAETAALAELIKCPDGHAKVTTTIGLPDLWGCILPGAEVLKLFVNEREDGHVEDVKIMWNDWTRDTGHGLHADRAMAEAWVTAIATRYAPEQVERLLDAFRGEAEATVDEGALTLRYTFHQGPAIAERLITITRK